MTVRTAENLQTITVKRIPPEGGWGILIGIGMALPFVSTYTNTMMVHGVRVN